MPPVRILRITLPLVFAALFLCLLFKKPPLAAPSAGGPALVGRATADATAPDAAAVPSPVRTAAIEPSPAARPPEPAYQAGYFPGVSTRHVPGPDPQAANDPPAHVPHEVTLPSGEKLIHTLTDERDAIPLMPTPAR